MVRQVIIFLWLKMGIQFDGLFCKARLYNPDADLCIAGPYAPHICGTPGVFRHRHEMNGQLFTGYRYDGSWCYSEFISKTDFRAGAYWIKFIGAVYE
jgi:hypothetical protein